MQKIAERFGFVPRSLVFPRNQTDERVLRIVREHGILAYRGNEQHVLYKPRRDAEQLLFIRALRLLDNYINVSGHHTTAINRGDTAMPINIPSSRFLRPWSKTLSVLEPLRLKRIKNSMTHAAKNGECFHLWWHPHNFGTNLDQNMAVLKALLDHYASLKKEYKMESKTMLEASELAQ
jgi:hypothetical protein